MLYHDLSKDFPAVRVKRYVCMLPSDHQHIQSRWAIGIAAIIGHLVFKPDVGGRWIEHDKGIASRCEDLHLNTSAVAFATAPFCQPCYALGDQVSRQLDLFAFCRHSNV